MTRNTTLSRHGFSIVDHNDENPDFNFWDQGAV